MTGRRLLFACLPIFLLAACALPPQPDGTLPGASATGPRASGAASPPSSTSAGAAARIATVSGTGRFGLSIRKSPGLAGERIATAWPYTGTLSNGDYGYVQRPLAVVETNDFHVSSVRSIPPDKYDVLVVYTRTWTPDPGFTSIGWVRGFLERYYEYAPEISAEQCASLGLQAVVSWERRGQTITIYERH